MYRAVLGEKEYHSIKARDPAMNDKCAKLYSKPEDRRAYEAITDFERLQIMPHGVEFIEMVRDVETESS